MTKYEQMLAQARKAYSTRKAAMVRRGMTSAEAKATMKTETDRRRNAEAVRVFCLHNNRVAKASIGEIYAAKMAKR